MESGLQIAAEERLAELVRAPAHGERNWWLALIGAVLTVKCILLGVDHAPMFFLGDSEAYLATAKSGYIPADRSFLYGWLIWLTAYVPRSLTMLLVAQMLASAAGAVLCVFILRRYFAAPRAIAAAAGLLCAVEPLQLLYERYMMTEAFSLLAFVLFVTAALSYLKQPTMKQLAWMQIAGVFAIALRYSFLPMVQSATLLVPLLTIGISSGARWRRIAAHLLLSVVLFAGLHGLYKRAYAYAIQTWLPGAEPAYLYDNGFHLLCFVGPIAEPQDFPHPETAAEIFQTDYDLKDPHMRGKQRWGDGGLIGNVCLFYPHLEANRLAETTAWNAVRRNPWGEFRLALFGYGDYWNLEDLHIGMVTDRGSDRELPDELLEILQEDFHIAGAGLPHLETLSNRWYFAAWPWYLALLLLPIPLLAMIGIVPAPHRPAAILLFVFGGLQIVVISACSITPTVRFLHATAWLALIVGGVFATRLQAWRNAAPSLGR